MVARDGLEPPPPAFSGLLSTIDPGESPVTSAGRKTKPSRRSLQYESMSLRHFLERYFEFQALGADWRTEILAGCTTFMTMAYIVFVNPAILHETGMPLAAVTAAPCLSAAAGSFLMGGFARYPIALAPGMGLNAYFTYAVVKGMGVPWPAALGAVFLSGVAFLVLTLLGVRQLILSAIPHELYAAVAAGVGLFIAFTGFRNSGIIVPNAATTVTLGNLTDKSTALALFGLLLIGTLLAWRVRAAMLIGILTTTAAGLATGVAKWNPQFYRSEEHTSELQSPCNLVCRLLLAKKNGYPTISLTRIGGILKVWCRKFLGKQ